MIEQTPAVNEIAHLISLAIAPVFLLAGIGSILNVLAARLARVVDRARRLEIEFETFDPDKQGPARAELSQDRRGGVVRSQQSPRVRPARRDGGPRAVHRVPAIDRER